MWKKKKKNSIDKRVKVVRTDLINNKTMSLRYDYSWLEFNHLEQILFDS